MTRTNSDYRTTRPPINILGELKEGYELVEESTWRGKKYYIQRRGGGFWNFILLMAIVLLLMWFFSGEERNTNAVQKLDNTPNIEVKTKP